MLSFSYLLLVACLDAHRNGLKHRTLIIPVLTAIYPLIEHYAYCSGIETRITAQKMAVERRTKKKVKTREIP